MTSQKFLASKSNSYSFLYRLIDLSILFLSLPLAAYLYGVSLGPEHLVAVLIISIFFLYFSESFELYRSRRIDRFSEMFLRVGLCVSIAFLVAVTLAFLLKESDFFSRVTIVLWFMLSLFFSLFWRVLQRQCIKACLKSGIFVKKVAIVGATDSAVNLFKEIQNNNELGYELVGVYDDRSLDRVHKVLNLNVIGRVEDAIKQARDGNIDILFLALPLQAEKRIGDILLLLGDTTVDVHYLPNFFVSNLIHSRVEHVGAVDTLSVYESPYLGPKRWLKRTEDIVGSLIILCVIAIPLLLISLAIKVTSSGPILFKQRRYGLRGEEILVWKFRSMYVMESDGKVIQATKNDPRITPLGAFLRCSSLDELPQFFNVLRGDMSLVGPRPHAVAHNEEYRRKVQFYMLRHKVKPGITGWAQINGWRGETDTLEKMEKRVEFDLQYIKTWSLWFDLKIIWLTIFKGFVGKNAY
ncbi:Undecaprenyl-phosphate galactose phosphotransferase [Psychromonas ingrahamii 37]|uniref:Undecaprenyl-phosphate galactose phosphotransferase n=1 Tax=Psychromonas ingrahamii (strain DSM 17664 / CCUG 51855 / 37) TaxID=357804 RepID=A1SS53_PSYIN|nr:undecaprenyl-phosphate glucose phosphotransferase [Psychromonas ingrahamii]ABM02318.1 Undecaprenyl-phosphate galactose phosphotransferase [Psychromonas ingrahamii 37]